MKMTLLPLLLLLGAPSSGLPQEHYSKQLCLTPKPFGQVQGFGNFVFSGRVWGEGSSTSYGHWVVAIDTGDAAWAQSGGGVRGQVGTVRFGVHNGSSYPLSFVVIEVPTEADYADLRRKARVGSPLTVSDNRVGPYTIMSRLNDCTFTLSSEDTATAAPSAVANRCSCQD